jgi:hypothetical protein
MMILSGASGSHIADGTTEHCYFRNILVQAERVRIHNTRIVVANTSDEHPGENNSGITSIVGLHSTGILSHISDCDIEVGAFTFSGDTNLTGSTGVIVAAGNITIDNLKIIGSDRTDELGIRVAPNLYGGDFLIDARGGGFDDTDDRVVKFDSPGMGQIHGAGQVWYILYREGDEPVEISSNWGSGLKIFKRSLVQSEWTQLTTGQAYPQ